jgi:TonB-dependent starch-binding outer membrane protein SusC
MKKLLSNLTHWETNHRILPLLLFFLLMNGAVGAQTKVSGIVTDDKGLTLPGVNVLVVGTTKSTITDFNGKYQMEVPVNGVLSFSFLGFNVEKIAVRERSIIDVKLISNTESLKDVVVIGYGTQKKGSVNSAISSVKSSDLENLKVVSVDQMLQGKLSGVSVTNNSGQPGSSASIRVRGTTSISGTNEPLYIVDGVPISGDATNKSTSGRPIVGSDFTSQGNNAVSPIAMINPNDIESIDVLKDASATAIYGSRGANGVIIITTKSGKKGTGKLTYDSYVGVQNVVKMLNVMDLQQYAKYQNSLSNVLVQPLRPEFSHPELLGKGTDWQDEVYRTALITSHQLSFSGAKDGSSYFISGGYLDQEGTVIGSGFKRYNLRVNTDSKVKNWLKVGTNITGAITNEDVTVNSSYNGIISNTLLQAPDSAIRNSDGTFAGPPNANQQVSYYNPVAMALVKTNTLIRKNFLGNVYAELDLAKGLKYRFELGANTEFSENNEFTPSYAWGTFTNDEADLAQRRQNWFSVNVKNLLTYDATLGKSKFTVLLGQEANDTHWEGHVVTATGFQSNSIQTVSVADASRSTVTDYKGSQGLSSYFSRIIYDFDNKYSAAISYRADGSSKFDTNNKWGYFPSASLSWKLSNENFMETTKDYIDNIKFRIGYGETGNQQIPNNLYSATLTAYGSGLGTGYLVNNVSNPDLKWETLKQTNLGLDFTLFDSKLSANIDLYNKLSSNFLFQVPLPAYLTGGASWEGGLSAPYSNIGSMENKGIDVTLNYNQKIGESFTWNTALVLSSYKNKVKSIKDGLILTQDINIYGGDNTVVTNTVVGGAMGRFYGYIAEGLFKSMDELNNAPLQFGKTVGETSGQTWLGDVKYKDVNDDGVIDESDRTFIGSPHPKMNIGFNNTFKYKNIDLSIFLQSSIGNDILNLTKLKATNNAMLYQNQLVEAADYWTTENTDTDIPRITGTTTDSNLYISNRYIEDGSYLRIQNLTLGYNFSSNILSKLKMSRLRLYGSIQNLYTFTKYSGYDPEIGSLNQNALLTGIDNGRYPASRTITVGLNVEF